MTIHFYKTPLANITVYEQLRIGINHLFGYPKTAMTAAGIAVHTETFLPLWEALPKDDTHAYWALSDEHLEHAWVGPLMAQNIAGQHIQETTEEAYDAAAGRALPPLPEPEEPEEPEPEPPAPQAPVWVQPTGAHDAYALNALVTHAGQTWRSTVASNVWQPGVYGWEIY